MNKTVYLVAAASALLSLAGCQLNKQTPDYSKIYANAIVTVKHTPEDVFYLQLDDKTTVKPSNMDESPFGDKQVRALAKREMEGAMSLGVPLEVSVGVGANWLEAH